MESNPIGDGRLTDTGIQKDSVEIRDGGTEEGYYYLGDNAYSGK
jgi:hypothetical protein